ncbi:MAG: hypothetical protein GY842_00580 [bacterium]|nr:hypothetical protein [bacterium]
MRVWGTVSYQGQPVEEGRIIFFPVDGTPGPSTGTAVKQGRYEVPARSGPRAGGVYRVKITAVGPERSYSPNLSGNGPKYTVRDQFIPAEFNRKSTLQVNIAARAEENQHDFEL